MLKTVKRSTNINIKTASEKKLKYKPMRARELEKNIL